MFLPVGGKNKQTSEEQFSRPVEYIMKCEDFKSNFARRLSNRHIAKSPAVFKHENMKLGRLESVNTQESVKTGAVAVVDQKQRQVDHHTEQGRETIRPPDKAVDIRHTEVAALNLEVETLRWQLAQTEANRQMNVALLKQVVSFLNRVKEHMESQKQGGTKKDPLSPRPPDCRDLPRSLSLLNVDNNGNATSVKRKNARVMSKSISNMSAGLHVENNTEHPNIWNQSKLTLIQENDSTKKIIEEIVRLIALANTVLNTKVPELACGSSETSAVVEDKTGNKDQTQQNVTESKNVNTLEENASALLETNVCEDKLEELINTFIEIEDENFNFAMCEPPLKRDLEGHIAPKDYNLVPHNNVEIETPKTKPLPERRADNAFVFIEDESGFSSMSSFQEIGIPIINIIPATPIKEQELRKDCNGNLDEDKWKDETIEIDSNTIKVFWV